jgi:hypothetical protein
MGCRAAREGNKALEDAHDAWLHGRTMEMGNTGKQEYLKVEDGDTEPFLFLTPISRRWQITMRVSRPDR